MNSKIRSILWEEVRVGGAIALLCGVLGVLLQVALAHELLLGSLADGVYLRMTSYSLLLTVGLPLLTMFLLTLNPSNSGHLRGGFSKRVMRLPVETSKAVLSILLTRLCFVFLVSALCVLVATLIYQDRPSAYIIPFFCLLYLLIQFLDWAIGFSRVMPIIFILCLVIAMIKFSVSSSDAAMRAFSFHPAGTPLYYGLFFILSSLLLCAGCIGVVHLRRQGLELSLSFPKPAARFSLRFPFSMRRRAGSPVTAQIWYELSHAGLFFPASVFIFFLIVEALWVYISLEFNHLGHGASSTSFSLLFLQEVWRYEIAPLIALILAACLWAIRLGWLKKKGAGSFSQLPITPLEMARARLWVAAVNLGGILLTLVLLNIFLTFFAPYTFTGGMLWASFQEGDLSLREFINLLFGPVIFAGALSWFIMTSGLAWRWYLNEILLLLLLLFPFFLFYLFFPEAALAIGLPAGLALLWFLLIYPSLFLLGALGICRRRGSIRMGGAVFAFALWGIAALYLYPSVGESDAAWPILLALSSITLAALPLQSYFKSLVATDDGSEKRAGAKQTKLWTRCGAVALLLGLLWLAWPAEPRWKEVWRAQGLPTNLRELDASYTHVPDEENLALRYMALVEKKEKAEKKWGEALRAELNLSKVEDDCYALPDVVFDNIIVLGNCAWDSPQNLRKENWHWSRRYAEEIAQPLCEELFLAQDQLDSTRFPIDLSKGLFNFSIDHNGDMRELARQLTLTGYVAAIQEQPDKLLDPLSAIFKLGDALTDVPSEVEQLTFYAIHSMGHGFLEDALSNLTCNDLQLKAMQQVFEKRSDPGQWEQSFRRSLAAEALMQNQFFSPLEHLSYMLQGGYKVEFPDGPEAIPEDTLQPKYFEYQGARVSCNLLALFMQVFGLDSLNFLTANFSNGQVTEINPKVFNGGDPQCLYDVEKRWSAYCSPRAIFFFGSLNFSSSYLQMSWCYFMKMKVVQTAISVERFRIANEKLPDRLDALVPEYLDEVPLDIWNPGHPLSYRIKENGDFVVYSFAQDQEDDRGEVDPERNEFYEGDISFTIRAPESRHGLRVEGGVL